MPVVVLDVHMRMPDGSAHVVGEVSFSEPGQGGRFRTAFRYKQHWLSSSVCFDLDPRNLPLSSGTAEISNRDGLRPRFGCLEDALPDNWGRSLLRELARNAKEAYDAQLMRLMGAGALGALAFSVPGQAPDASDQLAVRDLEELLDAAERFERHEEIDSARMRRLLAAGSTPGGARPKALVFDEQGMWLAKFPSRYLDAGFDNVGLEASCLALAFEAKLDVPQNRLLQIAGKKILLVRRFDIPNPRQNQAQAATHRYHAISMASLVGLTDASAVSNYTAMSTALRMVSARPREDVRMLFRHMLVNAAIGNTDDHLRNFRLLHKEEGWRLSPAYDLLPDVGRRQEHAIDFGFARICPDRAIVAKLASDWGVSGHEQIVEEVCSAAGKFEAICKERDVPVTDRDFFASIIARRVARLKAA